MDARLTSIPRQIRSPKKKRNVDRASTKSRGSEEERMLIFLPRLGGDGPNARLSKLVP
jgi:hypothetical protein